jgi:hypothetical protein
VIRLGARCFKEILILCLMNRKSCLIYLMSFSFVRTLAFVAPSPASTASILPLFDSTTPLIKFTSSFRQHLDGLFNLGILTETFKTQKILNAFFSFPVHVLFKMHMLEIFRITMVLGMLFVCSQKLQFICM